MERVLRYVEGMDVDTMETSQQRESGGGGVEAANSQASGAGGGTILTRIGNVLKDISDRLGRRKLFKRKEDGTVRVANTDSREEEGETEVKVEEVVGSDCEEEIDVRVEKEESKEMESENKSTGSAGTTTKGYSFLEQLDEEERVEEEDRTSRTSRKRKAQEEGKESFRIRGLLNSAGWRERSKETREDDRWSRNVERNEGSTKISRKCKIPLPEEFNLGLDIRGMEVNNASRRNSNMGCNKKAVFTKKENMKGEARNWISSFTRVGCIGCRNEKGESNHGGRSAEPVILIIGDESVPSAVGHTRKGEASSCTWIFKKEHLALEEVASTLNRLNEEKKEWDIRCGRRAHEFFIPNGSKILVASYTHLRKEGLEGYIGDFNNMVKDVWALTGDIGIEVLPCVPVVFENIDQVGEELLAGMRNWIEWISEVEGKEAVGELSRTGGEEICWARTSTVIYRPSFVIMTPKGKKEGEVAAWRNRGNRLEVVRGERKEVELRHAATAKGIEKLMAAKGVKIDEEEEEEKEKRNSFRKGVSMEGEYCFAKAVSDYTRKARENGSYNGRQVGNVREQLAVRAALEEKEVRKKLVFFVGGSQIKRIGEKVVEMGGEVVEVGKVSSIKGQWTREKVEKVRKELEECETVPDCIVIGGPGGSTIRHGPVGRRGFGPEMRMILTEGMREGKIRIEYHLTEPVKISMLERSGVARLVELLVEQVAEILPLTQIWYLGPAPRHVVKCCEDRGHMQAEDVWVIEGQRRELDMEIERRITNRCEIVKWYEAKGLEKEPEVEDIRRMRVVSEDGVHLTEDWCRSSAVHLCFRMGDNEVMLVKEDGGQQNKRPRL